MNDLFKFDTKSTSLLGKEVFREKLKACLRDATENILICSGFVTQAGVSWIREIIPDTVNCTILTTWKPKNIIEGGSDVESLKLCLDNNWDFMLHADYHGKAIKIDKSLVAIGSANLTKNGYGLGMIPCDREETGIIKELSNEDDLYFSNLLMKAHKLTNDDYLKMSEWFKNNKIENNSEVSYPKLPLELDSRMVVDTEELWVENFPLLSFEELSSYTEDDVIRKHDLELFEVKKFDEVCIRSNFKKTYIYNWLINILRKNAQPMNFGKVTDIIHNSLMNDARHYRSDVKKLQSNLYSYIKRFNYDDVQITQPNRSEILTLII